jgi:CheY-like chemotaxis protein
LDYVQRNGTFDLVVMDFNMPELDGDELMRQISVLRPTTPVILVTGHAGERITSFLKRFPEVMLLPKPYSLGELNKTLNKAVPKH